MSHPKTDEVIEYLRGTANSLSAAADKFDLTEEEALDIIVEADEIDLCCDCGWWCENSELEVAENGSDLVCEDCRESE